MMPNNEVLTVIYRKYDKRIEDKDRLRIKYIIKTLETRGFSPRVFNMVFNYVLLMLECSDYHNLILSFELFFKDILTDAFTPGSKKYHIDKFDELN